MNLSSMNSLRKKMHNQSQAYSGVNISLSHRLTHSLLLSTAERDPLGKRVEATVLSFTASIDNFGFLL